MSRSAAGKAMRAGRTTAALLMAVALAASVLLVLLYALPAQAQSAPPGTSITVDTDADENNTDGDCSLREAIVAANTNLATDACPAGSGTGEDAIGFDLGSSATITVGSRLPDITGAAGLVIDGGQAADLTVSGGGTSGVFEIDSGAKVAVEGITISDGVVTGFASAGGAIDNFGTLALTDVRVTSNSAWDTGGGGIINGNNGELTLTDSTVSDNRARMGAGIYNTGDLNLVNSTVSGNTAAEHAGGIFNNNDSDETVTIENSTIAGNTAEDGIGGGIFGGGGPTVIENSTVTDNADSASSGQCAIEGACGAVVNASSVEVRSTIIAGNDGADVHNAGGITSGGYNLIGSVTEADTATGGFDATADQVGVSDPRLGPLADNGGPTFTNLPLIGSPAIDQGNSFGATADQRGKPRPKDYASVDDAPGGDGSDVGAVELEFRPVDISVSGTTVTEGNAGTTDAVFTVRLSEPSEATVTIDYATEDDTASSPADYDGASGTVTFSPGDTLETVAVAVEGDALDEFAENFFLNLSNPQGPTATTGASAAATIRDDDPTPSLSVNDVTVTEADSGTATARFAVSLSAASGKTVVADYSTADGTARVADGDYSEAFGTLTFRPGVAERNVAVTINADTKGEPAQEDFFLMLSGAENAGVTDGEGVATIEDAVPTVLRGQPSGGATGVPTAANVVAVFSKEMDPGTVNAQTFYLQEEGSSETIPAAVRYDATYRRAILDPTSRLTPGASYTATVKGGTQGMKDTSAKELAADKTWSFAVAPDRSAPSVLRVTPSEGATGVGATANVAATFSEAMAPASIDADTVKLYEKGSTTLVLAAVTYDATTRRAVLNPSANLTRGITYKAVVTTGAKDLAGNRMETKKIWFFTIRP